VVSGNPTSSEVAAVTAVLAALEAEQAAEAAARKAPATVSAWQQSRRGLRSPITVGPGQWLRHAP
jgi:sarcosine oxidase gamma subunit